MKVRAAKVTDAKAICDLIHYYAEREHMLFRSMADIYENLQTFLVAEDDGRIVGCCALQVIWADLAEIKSLAVDADYKGKGVGKMLAAAAAEKASMYNIPNLFALTLVPGFFRKMGFETVAKDKLPMKVWKDCAKCSKQDHCDEVALIYSIEG